jgi:hypothetical protein
VLLSLVLLPALPLVFLPVPLLVLPLVSLPVFLPASLAVAAPCERQATS